MIFESTNSDIDAIKVASGRSNIIVKGCKFNGIGGGAIRVVSGAVDNVKVIDNEIYDSRNTAMYFGNYL